MCCCILNMWRQSASKFSCQVFADSFSQIVFFVLFAAILLKNIKKIENQLLIFASNNHQFTNTSQLNSPRNPLLSRPSSPAVHVEAHVEAALATRTTGALLVGVPVFAGARHEGSLAIDAFYPVLM